MLETILAPVVHFVIDLISSLGYVGVAIAMAIESACIPLPSEIIMPFAGYVVSTGRFTLLGIALAGTVGCLIGSLAAYALGYWGGESVVRAVIRKYGKYVLVHESELDQAIAWFDKFGSAITFSSRLLPVVRTFISLPAGIARMPISPFIIYSTLGSFLWSYLLGYIGLQLGENWDTLGVYFHRFDAAIVIVGVASVAWYISHKLKKHAAH